MNSPNIDILKAAEPENIFENTIIACTIYGSPFIEGALSCHALVPNMLSVRANEIAKT